MPSRLDKLIPHNVSSRQMMMPRAWSVTGSGSML